jgi:hypothetical protein
VRSAHPPYSDAMSAGPPGPNGPVTSVPAPITRMQAIGAGTPPGDGLACFNRMYLQVTQEVGSDLAQGFFADPDFMSALDVTFANLYFAAVDVAANPVTVPLAWRPLIELRARKGIEPIQSALAGMNAHINHDLPIAVVSTCTELATAPAAGSHLADYQKVDRLLDAAEQSIRQSFESAPELAVDRRLQAVGNLVANWTIDSARDAAWRNALILWELRDDPVARGLFLVSLAEGTAPREPAAARRGMKPRAQFAQAPARADGLPAPARAAQPGERPPQPLNSGCRANFAVPGRASS